MEVMEDGNLMDKVNILIQRDMEYYTSKQAVLQELICPGIIGGRLDFPRSASFAAMKIVLWWEEEYIASYRKPSGFLQDTKDSSSDSSKDIGGCGGIVKASDPAKFIHLISKSADQFLEHLHILTQEALDHADLTVLTGTIGAAALLKNCLWFYIHSINEQKSIPIEALQTGYKKYHEMCEALAERLLDLHCRLLSLYILQDAECLDWENSKPFCESERGSFVIQMWWLYMQGTKEDLWNTVPPKMAQRVFSGMLNESLTILTVRYTQTVPSEARSKLLVVDISNLLLCVAQLLPAICDTAEEFLGICLNNKSKILRDIHVKCQDLLVCLLLRGAPLDILHKIFRKGLDSVQLFKPKCLGPMPWVSFSLPNIFKENYSVITRNSQLPDDMAIALELMVLLAQPQADWSQLLKVLCMKNCKLLATIMRLSLKNVKEDMRRTVVKKETCGAFLCSGDGSCKNVDTSKPTLQPSHYYDLILSATDILLVIGNDEDFSTILLPLITSSPNWSTCFERRHVWNQIRPAWYEAILNLITPILPTITETVINSIQTGASIYQAMSLVLACFNEFWHYINPAFSRITNLLQEILAAEVAPLSNSVLIQSIISALYSEMLQKSEQIATKNVRFQESSNKTPLKTTQGSSTSLDPIFTTQEGIALALAESLCSIDEDNKHTDQIEELLDHVKASSLLNEFDKDGAKRVEDSTVMVEVMVSDLLLTTQGKKSLKTLYHFVKNNSEWLLRSLSVGEENDEILPNRVLSKPKPLLHTMFHIGYRPFDQLLTGDWLPNWLSILQIPMGLNSEKAWMQISSRWEFRDVASPNHSQRDIQIINYIITLLKS